MSSSYFVVLLTLAAIVSLASAGAPKIHYGRFGIQTPGRSSGSSASTPPTLPSTWCSGKPNGNYCNPVNCESFVSCSNGVNNIIDCAKCTYDPLACPNGKLIFSRIDDKCLYRSETFRCGSCSN